MTTEERFDKLEQELKRVQNLKALVVVMAFLAAVGILTSAALFVAIYKGFIFPYAFPSSIRANTLRLVDEKGIERAQLCGHEKGARISYVNGKGEQKPYLDFLEPGAVFMSSNGQGSGSVLISPDGVQFIGGKDFSSIGPDGFFMTSVTPDSRDCSVMLGIDETGPNLRVRQGEKGAALTVDQEKAVLSLGDDAGSRVGLLFGQEASVYVTDGKEAGFVGMLTATENKLGFVLQDGDGKPRVGVAAGDSGSGVVLCDAVGTPRADLFLSEMGPRLSLYDAKGTGRATLGISGTETSDGKTTAYPESSLLLFGPDSTVLWAAPR
jgi:hypothetical protein